MKLRFLLKDPDGIYHALADIKDEDLRDEVRRNFFTYSDYINIEIDTDSMTAIVIKK